MNIVEAVISVLCAIYTRVSTDDQVHSVFGSLEKQFEMCRKHLAGERGWVHHATYSDPAVSGKEWDRDGLQELLRAVAEGTLKMVIVYHSSRLSRVLVDTIRILEHFAKHGCGLYSLGEGFIDISTPEARLNAAQRAAQNEYQHGQIVKNVREGVVMKVASGYWQCGWAPWGFLRDLPNCTIVQDPETAPLVREVFERTAAGECFGDIAADLNARGIRTPKRRHSKKAEGVGGHEFDTDYLWAVIQNVAYKGFGRTRYIQARHIPAPVYIDAEGMAVYKGNHYAVRIVDEDLWDRANTKAAANKRRFYSANAFKRLGDSPLMGFIKCGHCSGAMSPTYSLKKTKTGINRHRYYACQNVVQNGKQCECDVRRISAPLIESIVMQGMGPIGWHPDVITATVQAAVLNKRDQAAGARTRLKSLEKELVALDKRMNHYVQVAGLEGMPAFSEKVRAEIAELGGEQKRLTQERWHLRAQVQAADNRFPASETVAAGLKNLEKIVKSLPVAKQHELLRLLISDVSLVAVKQVPSGATKPVAPSTEFWRVLIRFRSSRFYLLDPEGKPPPVAEDEKRGERLVIPFVLLVEAPRGWEVRGYRLLSPVTEEVGTPPPPPAPPPVVDTSTVPHALRRAIKWQELLVKNRRLRQSDIAKKNGLTRACVCQHFSLLKLAKSVQTELLNSSTPVEVLEHFGLRRLLGLLRSARGEKAQEEAFQRELKRITESR